MRIALLILLLFAPLDCKHKERDGLMQQPTIYNPAPEATRELPPCSTSWCWHTYDPTFEIE